MSKVLSDYTSLWMERVYEDVARITQLYPEQVEELVDECRFVSQSLLFHTVRKKLEDETSFSNDAIDRIVIEFVDYWTHADEDERT